MQRARGAVPVRVQAEHDRLVSRSRAYTEPYKVCPVSVAATKEDLPSDEEQGSSEEEDGAPRDPGLTAKPAICTGSLSCSEDTGSEWARRVRTEVPGRPALSRARAPLPLCISPSRILTQCLFDKVYSLSTYERLSWAKQPGCRLTMQPPSPQAPPTPVELEEAVTRQPMVEGQSRAHAIAQELLSSEKAYVEVLQHLHLGFHEAVTRALDETDQEGQDGSSRDELRRGLSELPAILELHQGLLEELEERLLHWEGQQKVADLFLAREQGFEHHAAHILQFDRSLSLLAESCLRCPPLAAAVREFEQSLQGGGENSKHRLLRVVQRLFQYQVLLTDYLNNLCPDSAEYESTQGALTLISKVTDHANDSMEQGENLQKLVHIEHSVRGQGDLLQPGREFLKEGTLMKVTGRNRRPRHLFLVSPGPQAQPGLSGPVTCSGAVFSVPGCPSYPGSPRPPICLLAPSAHSRFVHGRVSEVGPSRRCALSAGVRPDAAMSDVLLYTYPQKDGKYRLKSTLAVASMKVTAWRWKVPPELWGRSWGGCCGQVLKHEGSGGTKERPRLPGSGCVATGRAARPRKHMAMAHSAHPHSAPAIDALARRAGQESAAVVRPPAPEGLLSLFQVSRPVMDKVPYALKIETPEVCLALSASSCAERDEWHGCLSRALPEDYKAQALAAFHHSAEIRERLGVSLGERPPTLVPVTHVMMCMNCGCDFSLTLRRHHCHACGKIVCRNCSRNKYPLKYLKDRMAKVCDGCYGELKKRGGDVPGLMRERPVSMSFPLSSARFSSSAFSSVFHSINPATFRKQKKVPSALTEVGRVAPARGVLGRFPPAALPT
ncbi:FYVE, RhoGEF and PH domain-containing protein 5 [Galemys pyrenaicus]|uniref:FYVE, RhoGEF and PH domain-containing protein 5 n=1 Tax=Galemys pyrenaicus TaxID=202257 RepID=A0A8J6ACM1_GALPY|nr:FYVE, RhoGEF and PH domain-containing protein 5 [Galemys pyrenaicus]